MSDTSFRICMLGRFHVERGTEIVAIEKVQSRAARQLFKWLLSRRTRRLPREEAVEALWPESSSDTSTVRGAIRRLRQVLEPGVDPSDSLVSTTENDVFSIRRDADVWVDADEFERMIAESAHAEDPAELWDEADRLYAGDYLPDDLYDDWAIQRRDSLRNLWTELQFDLSQNRAQRGDVSGAILALQRVLEKDRCDERAARELMLLLARHGRRSEALRVYQRLVEGLKKDFEDEPSEETIEVYRQISARSVPPASEPAAPSSRRGRPRPAAPMATPAPEPVVPTRLPPVAPAEPPTPYEPTYPFPTPELLIGRQGDLLTARQALERGFNGGQVLLIGAPAGTGKSSLAGSIVERAQSVGYLCLAGGSFDQDSPTPYGSIRDALSDYLLSQPPHQLRSGLGGLLTDLEPIVPELRGHLPELADRAILPPEPSRLQAAVYGCLRALARQRPVLLCLDDLHASDGATLELFRYLARQTRRLPITLVTTYRTEELSNNRALAHLISGLSREGLSQELPILPLHRAETQALISALLDGAVSDALVDSLFAITEGNPLFIEQFVLALREERSIGRIDGVWDRTTLDDLQVPPVVQSVIERRFERLPVSGPDILAMAAVLGPAFDLETLVEALGLRDRAPAIGVLDAAIRAQLVRESAGRYRFGHAMIREALYRSLTVPGRALLHAQAGAAIERLAGDDADERAAELALHFALAADAIPTAAKTLHYSLEAGRQAAALSAHREALHHFAQACELARQHPDLLPLERHLDALDGRGQAERNVAQWRECIASYREILAVSDHPARRAQAHDAIGRALLQVGDQAEAIAEFEVGLAELERTPAGPDVEAARVRLMFDQAFPILLQGRPATALELGRQMLPIAERLGQPALRYNAHSVLAIAHMRQGRAVQAEAQYALARAAAEQLEDKLPLALVHENLGAHHYYFGDFDRARRHLEQARGLLHDMARDQRGILSFRLLALVHLAEGDLTAALAQAELAYKHAIESGDRLVGECYDALGSVHAARTDWEIAASFFERALGIYERVSNVRGIPDALIGLGLVHERQGALPRAEALYRQAVEVTRTLDRSPHAVSAHRSLGRLLLRQGDPSAREEIQLAHTFAESMPGSLEYAPTLLMVAELERDDDPIAALGYAERALAPAPSFEHAVEARLLLTTLHARAGRQAEARTHASRCASDAQQIGSARALGLSELALGRAALAPPAAASHFTAAIGHFERARTPFEREVALGDLALATSSV